MGKKRSDWAKIERSREARLWLTQILIPTVGTGLMVWSNPESREFIKTKWIQGKTWVADRFQNKKAIK